MSRYPLIADHGLIGDLQTAALVATDGTVDWFCAPRFDSPTLFGSLLDADKGGHFGVRAIAPEVTRQQLYFPDTAVLVTRFLTEDGVGEVVDFMPIADPTVVSDEHRIVRMLRCVRGEASFEVDLAPRFDYGRQPHQLHLSEDGVVFESPRASLTAHLVREPDDTRAGRVEATPVGDLRGKFTLTAGQVRGVVLRTGSRPENPRRVPPAEAWRLFEDTVAFWRRWLSQSTHRGRWRETLQRSAITLKLMTYAPSGGLVAAPTAGLPEQIGGERNWDYRYTWIRDASFSVYSLLGLGFIDEAAALGRWLDDRLQEKPTKGRLGPLNIMYRIDGSSDLGEEVLEHWEGYRGSAPVRIGNGAADQLQLDIYGEAMDSMYFASRRGLRGGYEGWTRMCGLLDWVTENWDQPEEGIWETRGGRKDFTYGRVMSWVALDRGIRLALETGKPANLDAWRAQRDAIYTQVMERGWNPQRRAFVQHYGSDVLDSSLLRMSTTGFIAPRTRGGCPPSRPWTRSWSPTAWSTATTRRPRRTACVGRKAPSPSAASPTSSRSPARASSTRHG
jgi:GH15 family glucan-1,4-alpha-glucosidase